MGYTLRIPKSWYNQLITMCSNRGFDVFGVAGQYMQESSWDAGARGDYVNGSPTSFGLGQIQVAAARDVGWSGSDSSELLQAELNITLSTAYLAKCRDWAQTYDKLGDIAKYGLFQCALSVYNQGPGGFNKNGIARNLNSYVIPIMNWAANIQEGGIYPDDGGDPYVPPPNGPAQPPIPTPPVGGNVIAELSKWSESLQKSLDDVKKVRPFPGDSDFHTDLGKGLYNVAAAIRVIRTRLESWLGELEG